MRQAGNLIFERPNEDDLERFFEIHSDPILLNNGYNPFNYETSKVVFKNLLNHWEANDFGTCKLSLPDNPDTIIGFGGIYYREIDLFGKVINLGMAFDKQYWGLGLAYETALKSISFGFKKLNVEKIYAFTHKRTPQR